MQKLFLQLFYKDVCIVITSLQYELVWLGYV